MSTMKAYKTLILEEKPPVLKVIFNRPEKLNCLSHEMIQELIKLLEELRFNREIKYVVFTGKGRVFSSGMDLADVTAYTDTVVARGSQMMGHDLINKIENLEQITFAAINGPIIGGALTLAMACDFRIMADGAKASVPETARGIFYTWGSTPRLVNLVGPAKAKEIIMLCEEISAEEAYRIGLVNRVAPADQIFEVIDKMIARLEHFGTLATRLTKKIINSSTATSFGNIMLFEPEFVEQIVYSGEPKEKILSFLEKRAGS